ncbi:Uncharacterised protein [Halioglobus japonicus]|nr:Uncharacterised protein [Halioglobus japonicus]
MHTTQDHENLQSKQRLRIEISNQVEAFLHSGGTIEVLKQLPEYDSCRQIGHWPAATELSIAPNIAGDF